MWSRARRRRRVPFACPRRRTPLRWADDVLIERLPEGPGKEALRASRFMIVCEVRARTERCRRTVTGVDVYGLTAFAIARGALLAALASALS
jgi:hypothetical protein